MTKIPEAVCHPGFFCSFALAWDKPYPRHQSDNEAFVFNYLMSKVNEISLSKAKKLL